MTSEGNDLDCPLVTGCSVTHKPSLLHVGGWDMEKKSQSLTGFHIMTTTAHTLAPNIIEYDGRIHIKKQVSVETHNLSEKCIRFQTFMTPLHEQYREEEINEVKSHKECISYDYKGSENPDWTKRKKSAISFLEVTRTLRITVLIPGAAAPEYCHPLINLLRS